MDITDLAFGQLAPVSTSGTAAAPTAGTAVCTLASGVLPAGTYDVAFITRVQPTAAADEVSGNENNMELRTGAIVRQNRLRSTKAPGAVYTLTDVQLDGSTALSINATGNATASTVYAGMLSVVKTS